MKLTSMKIVLIIVSLLLIACQHTPSFVLLSSGLHQRVITTSSHQHLLLEQTAIAARQQLHVYIEGDGIPWRSRKKIAQDPTPKSPLMLELMRKDTNPSLYLGRPCYFNRAEFGLSDQLCSPPLWTNARYSEEVVASMIAALRIVLAEAAEPYKNITLIGHSGGGTIAMLMAQQMPEVNQLVTIAANLDVQAWAEHHHFSPLTESMSPAQQIRVANPTRQLHFAGGRDEQVPSKPVEEFLAKIGQSLIVFPELGHHGWGEVWGSLLVKINTEQGLPIK
jgi:predicted alpha/beta hydrolase family esterase